MRAAAAATLVSVVLAGVVGCNPPPDSSKEDIGQVMLAIMQAPADGSCLRLTVHGSDRDVVRLFTLVPNQSATFLVNGLPLGSDEFSGEVFPIACGMVGATSAANWVSDPVSA